ncbi:MAG: hypothetical protein JSS27_12980 [Planctomycetes bacterium]|nr:hypothetical protein [Planctomycetota bacterium]
MIRRVNATKFRRGQAMVEYAIMIGAVALVCLVAATMLGHKAGDLLGDVAALLPGDDADDQGRVFVGKLIATQASSGGVIVSAGTPGDVGATNTLGLPGGSAGGTPLVADKTDGT